MATQPEAPRLERPCGGPRIVLLGEHHRPYGGPARTDPGDQGDAVDDARLLLPGHGEGVRAAGRQGAQLGVHQQHVVTAPLGGGALQGAQCGRAAARGGHVHVRFGREGRRERLGEDAVVVDHQNPDTRHRTPIGEGGQAAGTAPGGLGAARCAPAAAFAPPAAPPPGAVPGSLAPLNRHRPPPVLSISVRVGATGGRRFAELVAPGV
ncbi:hypothetical protein GCM10010342_58740 [Streptomyces anulatus]|nr:hypothetical protein GCM10010342_58740 [Streptomyces anulatus]